MTLFDKLSNANLPVISASESGDMTFSRSLTDDEQVLLKWLLANGDAKIGLLWQHITNLLLAERARCGLDANAEGKILMWSILGDMPQWRHDRIAAIDTWSDGAWQGYYTLRAQILAGQDVALPGLYAPCPHTFAELLFETPPL